MIVVLVSDDIILARLAVIGIENCVLHVSCVQQATVFLFCVQAEWCRWSLKKLYILKFKEIYQHVIFTLCHSTSATLLLSR